MLTTPVTNVTFEEYLTYDDGNGFHYELVDGRLELMNPPTIEHFLIVCRFFRYRIQSRNQAVEFTLVNFSGKRGENGSK